MIRSVSTRLALATALLLALPAATVAQESPEGIDWHLVRYSDGGSEAIVPWYVDATLRLDGSDAVGLGGCNGFGATYELDGDDIDFGSPGHTDIGCAEPVMRLEETYMAALPQVVSWATDSGVDGRLLYLRNANDDNLLTFETATQALTGSDIRALAAELDELRAQIDRHEERIDSIRIGTLRDRIKTLEAEVEQLSATPAPDSGGSGNSSAMNAAERVLLEAVPAGIAADCVPRRSDNPNGTVAALQCQPDSDPVVRDMAYYLMNENDASKVWGQRMRQWAVPENGKSCWKGQKSRSAVTGALGLAGCYVDGNGRANLRYATEVTNCRQLDAGDRRIKRPAVYIAVLGQDDDMARLTRAAEPRDGAGPRDLVEIIKRPGAAWDPSCLR